MRKHWYHVGCKSMSYYRSWLSRSWSFSLEPIARGTRLTVIESGFEKLPAERRDEAYQMNERGWAKQMRNIAAHLQKTSEASTGGFLRPPPRPNP